VITKQFTGDSQGVLIVHAVSNLVREDLRGDAMGLPMRRQASVVVIALIGFVLWLNYGWIMWELQTLKHRVEGFALLKFGDDWEKRSRQLGGPHATDCGRVRVRADPTAASACGLKAFHQGTPFRVRYDLQGIDSNVSAGLVFTPEGRLYGLAFDGDPMGHGGTSWSRQRAEKVSCPSPFHLYTNPNGRLNCFDKEAVPPHDIMSPNFESY